MKFVSKALLVSSTVLLAILQAGICRAAPPGDDSPSTDTPLTEAQQALALQIKSEIMSPCCWNGTVDTHNSAASYRISSQIDTWVSQGRSRDDITEQLASTYGDRILARPRRSGFGLVFYLGPLIFVGISGFLLTRWLAGSAPQASRELDDTPKSGQRPRTTPRGADDAELERRFEKDLRLMD